MPAKPAIRRRMPAGPVVAARGTVSVDSSLVVNRQERSAAHREESVSERVFSEANPPARVQVSAGLTVNMSNFEFVRVDVSVSLPCLPSEVEETYEAASEHVANFLHEEKSRWVPES